MGFLTCDCSKWMNTFCSTLAPLWRWRKIWTASSGGSGKNYPTSTNSQTQIQTQFLFLFIFLFLSLLPLQDIKRENCKAVSRCFQQWVNFYFPFIISHTHNIINFLKSAHSNVISIFNRYTVTNSGWWRRWVWPCSPQCCYNNCDSHLGAEYRVMWHKSRCDLTHCEQMLRRSLPRAVWHAHLWRARYQHAAWRRSWFGTCGVEWTFCEGIMSATWN